MRRGLLLLGASSIVGVFGAIGACSSSSDVPPGATPVEDAGDGGGGIIPDGAPPPAAVGDPCRGVPLPTDQHYVPMGMCARLVASGVSGVRQLEFAPNGDLFAQASSGRVIRMRDGDGDGYFQATEIVTYGNTGDNGNNCHIDVAGGHLYCGSAAGVARFTYSPDANSGGTAQPVITGMANNGHSTHTVHVYDGFLYVIAGSAGNATHESGSGQQSYDQERSVLKRFPLSSFTGTALDWSAGEVVVTGLRNMNGFTRTAGGLMYGVVNGLDNQQYQGMNVTNDNPGEQVVPLAMGNRFGYPFCFTAQRVVTGGTNVVAPGTQLVNVSYPSNPHDDAWCATNSMKPSTFIQAHSAPLDLTFFDDDPQGALPERYRGGAFVALHGSWNRSPNTGYKVIWIPFDAQGNAPMPTSTTTATTFPYETVFGGGDASGPQDGEWAWMAGANSDGRVRPAGVAISPVDGALYIAADTSGKIYRIGLQK
jgi:glucose/arabinose dehydrogenase